MTDRQPEKRDFTRIQLDLPVEVHQGGSVWHQRLVDVSLSGVGTDQPDVWDAQYNEPFTLLIKLDDGGEVELHAYLQHVEAGRLGFDVEHVDRENIGPLRELMEAHIDDIALLDGDLQKLRQKDDV